jgi:polysaccharide deacetylase 2 family uncharacterized protein YibQ
VAWPGGSGEDTLAGRRLLAEIDKRRLLYVGTHPRADGGSVAALPVPEVIGDEPPEALVAQLTALLDKARTDGGAIAYGAPTETTLTTLAQVLPEWRAAEIEVVSITALDPAVNLSAR